MSLTARAFAIAVMCAALAAGWWRLTAYYDARGYQRAKAEDAAAMQAQATRNRELQRAAEKRYTVQAEARERVIVETIVEVRRETQSLATCPVPDRARRLLNDAARCAADPAAAGCADLPVRGPA